MPRSNRFVRMLSVVWDRDAARRLQSEAENALGKAGVEGAKEFEDAMKVGGQKGARALTTQLQRQFRLRQAQLSQQLADGVINERAFRKEGEKAAREFNAGLSSGIKRLQGSTGGLTDAQFVGLGSRFKSTGGAGAAGLLSRSLLGPLATVFSARAAAQSVASEMRLSVAAADQLANSIQKLGGTAKLTGLDLGFLQSASSDLKDEFKLSTVIANDLTTEVAKLAAGAGDITKTQQAMAAFLDIGAARGMSAAQTLEAVGQAVLKIDEGTDKLFNKNPSTIYDQWAAAIGRTGESLSEVEQNQALLEEALVGGAKVQGAYLNRLKTTQGEIEQNALKLQELRAEFGKGIGPARLFFNELKVATLESLYTWATRATRAIGALGGELRGAQRSGLGASRMIVDPFTGMVISMPEDQRPPAVGMGDVRVADRAAGLGVRTLTPPPPPVPLTEEQKRAADAAADLREKQRQQEILKNATLIKEQSERLYIGSSVRTGVVGSALGPTERPGGELVGMFGVDTSGKTPMEQAGEDMERFGRIGEDVAASVSSAWQDAFAQMFADGVNLGNFFDGLWRGAAAAAGKALSEIASKEAAKEFAYALSSAAQALGLGAIGNLPGAALATGAWQGHLAAGLAWSALAGGAAAGAGAVQSRSPGSSYDSGLSHTRDTFDSGGVGPEINLYFNGPSVLTPEFERLILGTVQGAQERFGEEAKINLKTHMGRK